MSASDSDQILKYGPMGVLNPPLRAYFSSLYGLVFTPTSDSATFGWMQPFIPADPSVGEEGNLPLGTPYSTITWPAPAPSVPPAKHPIAMDTYAQRSSILERVTVNAEAELDYRISRFPDYAKYIIKDYDIEGEDNYVDILAGNVYFHSENLPSPISTYHAPVKTLGMNLRTCETGQVTYANVDWEDAQVAQNYLYDRIYVRDTCDSGNNPTVNFLASNLFYKGRPVSGLSERRIGSFGVFVANWTEIVDGAAVKKSERRLLVVETSIERDWGTGQSSSKLYVDRDQFVTYVITGFNSQLSVDPDSRTVIGRIDYIVPDLTDDGFYFKASEESFGLWAISSDGKSGTNSRAFFNYTEDTYPGEEEPPRIDYFFSIEVDAYTGRATAEDTTTQPPLLASNTTSIPLPGYISSCVITPIDSLRTDVVVFRTDVLNYESTMTARPVASDYKGNELQVLTADIHITSIKESVVENEYYNILHQEPVITKFECSGDNYFILDYSLKLNGVEVFSFYERMDLFPESFEYGLQPFKIKIVYIDLELGVLGIQKYHVEKNDPDHEWFVEEIWIFPWGEINFGQVLLGSETIPPHCEPYALPCATTDPGLSPEDFPVSNTSLENCGLYVEINQDCAVQKMTVTGVDYLFAAVKIEYHPATYPEPFMYYYPTDLVSKFGLEGDNQTIHPIRKV